MGGPDLRRRDRPLPNQAEVFNGMVAWNGDTTTNEVFGLMQTQEGWALHTPYYLSKGSGTVTQAGFLKNLDGGYLFAGISRSGFSVTQVPGDGTGESIIGAQALNYAWLSCVLLSRSPCALLPSSR